MEFWRGEAFSAYFNYLDHNGGFYYEVRSAIVTTRQSLISCCLHSFFRLGNRVCINSVGATQTYTRSGRRSSRARNVSTFSTRSGIRITSIRIVLPAIFGDAAGARATLTPRTTSVRTTNSDSSARPGADCFLF